MFSIISSSIQPSAFVMKNLICNFDMAILLHFAILLRLFQGKLNLALHNGLNATK